MPHSARALLIEIHPAWGLIRLNRPDRRNVLSLSVLAQLTEAFAQLAHSPSLRALVLTGADDVFSAGANLREIARLTPETAREFASRGQEVMRLLSELPLLTIAAVNGYCLGGGLDLALACDVRCAATTAVLAHPGAGLGIMTGWGGTQRLPRLIGESRALEMFLTARRVTAAEALQFGLVEAVGDPVLEIAIELAQSGQRPVN